MASIYRKSEIPDHLQKYFCPAEIGLEATPDEYVANMVEVFRLVRELLNDDGTLWLNLGDSYAASQSNNGGYSAKSTLAGFTNPNTKGRVANDATKPRLLRHGFKPKNLIGIPWRVAFALQASGWYLRSDIIWSKPNSMPESVTDRPTKSHEYIFLLSKSERYYYDADAIKEPAIYFGLTGQDESGYKDAQSYAGKHAKSDKQRGHSRRHAGFNERWDAMEKAQQCSGMRNKRSVWTVATAHYSGAHFATFPPALIEPCVMAGSRAGDIVFDPFLGSGTTAQVAQALGRRWLGCELNPAYVELIDRRTAQESLL